MDNKEKKKKLPLWLKTVIISISVPVVLAIGIFVAYTIMSNIGEKSLNENNDAPVMEPRIEQIEDEIDYQLVDSNTVKYNGETYVFNENAENILFLGIDSTKTVDGSSDDKNQADVLIIAHIDKEANTVKLINIPRDTMTDVKQYNELGDYVGHEERQIALSFAYHDGGEESCNDTVEAVSNLFYGLPIHGYYAFHMNCIVDINDAVGGVTVTVPEDLSMFDERLYKDAVVHLDGNMAMLFVQSRMELEDSSNDFRNERQKIYLKQFIPTAIEAVKHDLTLPIDLLDALSDYSVTDLSASEITYLISEVIEMDVDDNIVNLQGESVVNNMFSEKHLDEKAFYELVLTYFYEKH